MTHRSRSSAVTSLAVFVAATVTGAVAIGIPLGARVTAQTISAPTPTASVLESAPHSHDDDDSSQLTRTQEEALGARATAEGIGVRPDVVARRSGRTAAAAAVGSPGVSGAWEGPFDWPVLGVHVSLLPNGNVLAYDSVNDLRTEASTDQSFTRAMTFDPVTKAVVRVDETLGYNIFCSGLAKLASGVVFAAGGNLNSALDGINRSTTFDPSTNSWSTGPLMSQARWYPSVTPLANGEMLVTGGGPSLSEVRQTDGTFRALTNAQQAIWAKREYQWMIATSNGKTAYVGPDNQIGLLDTNGTGTYQSLGARDGKNRSYGSFASFAPGKVLISGGGYFDGSAVVVDVTTGATTATGSMAHQRRQHNLTVLADGTVLATGGFENSSQGLVDVANNVYDAEIYNPATGQWRTVAPQERARQYHSTAMLLPDGRVMSAGGGMCGACDAVGYFQRNAEIYTPPYLFAADGSPATRPTITSVSSQLGYGYSYPVVTPSVSSIAKVSLIRMSSVTHSADMEQRFLPLSFTSNSGGVSIAMPANANAAPPGWYLLFLLDNKGVPSIAAKVQIGAYPPPPTTTTSTTTTSPTTTTIRPTTTTTIVAANTAIVYDNTLRNGWLNWSWAVANLSAAGGRSGAAMEFEPDSWRGLYLHSDALPVTATGLDLWVNGRSGNQSIRIILSQNSALIAEQVLTGLGAGWQLVHLTASRTLAAGTPLDVIVQDWSGADQAPVLLDDVSLTTGVAPTTTTTTTPTATTTTTTLVPTTTTTTSTTTTTLAPTTTTTTSTTTTSTTTTSTTIPASGTTLRTLYADSFVDADNWSWAPNNPASTNPVKAGARALAVTASPWTAAVFHLRDPLTIAAPTRLEFWIHGGPTGGQSLTIQLFDASTTRGSVPVAAVIGGPVAANTWTKVSLDLAGLGITSGGITDVSLWYGVGDVGGTYSVDDVRLVRV